MHLRNTARKQDGFATSREATEALRSFRNLLGNTVLLLIKYPQAAFNCMYGSAVVYDAERDHHGWTWRIVGNDSAECAQKSITHVIVELWHVAGGNIPYPLPKNLCFYIVFKPDDPIGTGVSHISLIGPFRSRNEWEHDPISYWYVLPAQNLIALNQCLYLEKLRFHLAHRRHARAIPVTHLPVVTFDCRDISD
jgi:hypothetical protein